MFQKPIIVLITGSAAVNDADYSNDYLSRRKKSISSWNIGFYLQTQSLNATLRSDVN